MFLKVLLGVLLCCLAACGSNTRAPVEDRAARTSTPAPPSHQQPSSAYRVQRGDTLYSIAFRYGLDFRKVAAANRIPVPYTIYPGQKIHLQEVALVRARPTSPRPATSGSSASRTPPASKPASKTVVKPVPSRPAAPTPAKPAKDTFVGGKVSAWRWPASGKVTRGYSGSVHKGIDISGRRGDPVQAVAAGKVVYAGTGIVGFGELLIIKHNEVYLSAYGHNERLLVKEGQTVTAGQQVAEKGSSGTDTVKLHFEIRKEGKPIDPQRLLPRR